MKMANNNLTVANCESESQAASYKKSIQHLPLLVLGKIFKLLSNADRESCTGVCQRWHDIIDTEVGQSCFIGNGMEFNFPGHKSVCWKPIEVLSMVGINKCVFGELAQQEEGNNAHEGFLAPELVREVSFYGKCPSKLFHVIVSPVHWLNTLKLHLVVFLTVSFDSSTCNLSSLQRLSIVYTHPVSHLQCPFLDFETTAKELVHKNLRKFLNTSFFRRIKIFDFVGPYFSDKSENLIQGMRSFVARHGVTLKELEVNFPYEWNVEPKQQSKDHADMTDANNLPMSKSKDEVDAKLNWGDVQLSRLVIASPATIVPLLQTRPGTNHGEVYSAWSQKDLNRVWEALLDKQCHLEVLQYINKYEDWKFPYGILSRNVSHLTCVSLCVNSEYNVDFKAFSGCRNLRKFCLEGNSVAAEGGTYRNEDGISRVLNVHYLPECIEELCLSKLMLTSQDLEAMVDPESKQLPHLKSFQLYHVGRGLPEFGLTIKAVYHLFGTSNLSLSFWLALNAPSFQGAMYKSFRKVIDQDVETLGKMLEFCDTKNEVNEDFQFSTLNQCHIQRIRRKKE